MSPVEQQLERNLSGVRQRIEAACSRAQRDPSSVSLVAVTKYAKLEWIERLPSLGVRAFGESRPQQLVERAALLSGIKWHLIGQLQRNKVRSVLPHAALIHSVSSLRLLQRISDVAGELGRTARVLLQVNVSGEDRKQGFDPTELRRRWPDVRQVPHVQIGGLMTMAPLTDDLQAARPTFRGLRQLQDDLRSESGDRELGTLSMGMTGDLEVAIEEGATMVRIGSALFDGME